MTFLLNRPIWTFIIPLVVGGAVTLDGRVFTFLNGVYSSNASSLSSVLFSLLGFVVAAFAIIVSLFDRGMFQRIAQADNNLGDQIIMVLSNTSKILAVFGFVLLLTSTLKIQHQPLWIQISYTAVYTFLFILSTLQVAKVIYVLERAAFLARGK